MFDRFREQVGPFQPSPVPSPPSPSPYPTNYRPSPFPARSPGFPRFAYTYGAPSLSLPDSRHLYSNNAQYRMDEARREVGGRPYPDVYPSPPRAAPAIMRAPTSYRSHGRRYGDAEENFETIVRPFLLFQLVVMLHLIRHGVWHTAPCSQVMSRPARQHATGCVAPTVSEGPPRHREGWCCDSEETYCFSSGFSG